MWRGSRRVILHSPASPSVGARIRPAGARVSNDAINQRNPLAWAVLQANFAIYREGGQCWVQQVRDVCKDILETTQGEERTRLHGLLVTAFGGQRRPRPLPDVELLEKYQAKLLAQIETSQTPGGTQDLEGDTNPSQPRAPAGRRTEEYDVWYAIDGARYAKRTTFIQHPSLSRWITTAAARLRLGVANLAAISGAWDGTAREQRVCSRCPNTGAVDDALHCMFACPHPRLEAVRAQFQQLLDSLPPWRQDTDDRAAAARALSNHVDQAAMAHFLAAIVRALPDREPRAADDSTPPDAPQTKNKKRKRRPADRPDTPEPSCSYSEHPD